MPLEKLYYINVGKDGTFKPSGNSIYDTSADDVDKLFDDLLKRSQKKLLIYFHGGLVKADEGMKVAERITRYTTEQQVNAHPICFVWETGLLETLGQNWEKIGNSGFFKKLLTKVIRVAGKKLGLDLAGELLGSKGVGSLSDAEIMHELEQPTPFEQVKVNIGKRSASLKLPEDIVSDDIYIDNVVKPEVDEEMILEIESDPELQTLAEIEKPELVADEAGGKKGLITGAKLVIAAVKITIAVIKRHIKNRDHGFYPTVIEEVFRAIYISDIGSWVWSAMKNKAAAMWKKDDFTSAREEWHAGSYFLKKLSEYQQQVGNLTIDLVGHSAGSIVICEMIKKITEENVALRFRNILFLAPACRCDLFADTVLKHNELFDRFRMFTMQDIYEINDRLAGALYTRSLLYFVSGVLEGDEADACLLGLERHIAGRAPYIGEPYLKEIYEFIKEQDRCVFAVTKDEALDGLRSGSLRHGDFDNDKETTLDSVFYLVKQ
jgi:hypothetical protein